MQDFLSFASVALAIGPALVNGLPKGLERTRVLHHARDVADSYDYIIVGGGTAGLTVADRLTEDEKTTVLVIEHGDMVESPLISTVQGGFSGMSAQFMYSINSVPQVNLHNHSIGVLAGKVVGGSSAVNAMMTVRGTEEDYDRWGQFFSNSSTWSWEGLLPYFKRALNFVPPFEDVTESSNITYDTSYWGNTSGVYTGWPSYQYPGTKVQLDAFREVEGAEFTPDSGSGRPGVYWFPQFMDPKNVSRSYAKTGHYDEIKRDNYQLIPGSKVLQIEFNGTTATGVTFVSAKNSSMITTVSASKEVIVAAGGVHSPQVLQRSGIGPQKLLSAANISTLVDLPGVGQNFQDHPMLQMRISLTQFNITPSSGDLFGKSSFHDWADEAWAENKTGPYSIATTNAAAWLPFPVISPQWSDIADKLAAQDPAAQLPEGTDETVVAGYGAQMKSYAAALRRNGTAFFNLCLTPGGAGSGAMVDLHPLSRGTVNIKVDDPFGAEPIVDYRALSNPLDTTVMTEMMRFTRRFYFNNTANAQYVPREMSPGSRVQSDEDFADYLSNTLSPTEYHPAGTCAMMPREMGGVVDEKLRVYGVKNLRVVDASIMPTLPSGNTCQTVYAVAEKAADIIKEDAAPKRRSIRRA